MVSRVTLRRLSAAERRELRAKLRDLSVSARIHQRYRVVDELRQGRTVAEAAARAGCHFTVAYDWLHRFNEDGFTRFELVTNPKGRPPILRAAQLRELVDVAMSSPLERGLPFTTWSVAKLATYCRRRRLLPEISDEWVRRVLRREGLSAQRIRTWKQSTDPAFDSKKNASGDSTARARRAAP